MGISNFLNKLVLGLSEENYDRSLSDYQFWMGIGARHGWIPDGQLYNDILGGMSPDTVNSTTGQLVHGNSHLLLRFITDVGLDPALSTYIFGTHERLCRQSLNSFFANNLDFISRNLSGTELRRFYTDVNFFAHWANLGYPIAEDVRNHTLQSTVYFHQLNSLAILLNIFGFIFAASVSRPISHGLLW